MGRRRRDWSGHDDTGGDVGAAVEFFGKGGSSSGSMTTVGRFQADLSAAEEREGVAGDLLIETVAPELGAQVDGAEGERRPVPEVPVSAVVVDESDQRLVDPVVDRVVAGG